LINLQSLTKTHSKQLPFENAKRRLIKKILERLNERTCSS
jgi:arylamine N-acetyltransferase